jgi:hypothetical protein
MDAFVTKLNSTGSGLVYSTYIGSDSTLGSSIAIDASGNAYITGVTASSNFPTTSGAYQTTFSGGGAFIIELNSSGNGLVYSALIGVGKHSGGSSIAIDASGNAYITGVTWSSNYPTTSGAYQTSLGGVNAINTFVTKLNSTGTALLYSTYIGGNNDDEGASIAVDASGNAYITGETWSSNYPTTNGAFQTSYPGSVYNEGSDNTSNAFVTKLNSTGSALVYSTFIGGSGNPSTGDRGDEGNSIAIDDSGNAYIAGFTVSTNYPITNSAYQITLKAYYGNAFITKLNSIGSALVYSTYIGGNGENSGQGGIGKSIALDASGNAYITGVTLSKIYPIPNGAYQDTLGDGNEAFVTKLNSTGSTLLYSTYIGDDSTAGTSIAIDASGNAYITGVTTSSNYPTTSGAYQATFSGGQNAFVTKLNISNATFVQSNNSTVPNNFELMQNYPNPFNPSTTISFAIPSRSRVSLKIFDVLGREVSTIVFEEMAAGSYTRQWNASTLASGVYFYRLQAGTYNETKKLLLLK